ncbi:uncharacterized protein LOC107800554 [Nicotiana tabacum]|uniref:Uncharacterized protein LOC107800554 n=1 Tax=Nicotiana tabacum TaxID=4097 RepID=A0A1S4AR54_TOBAC|nr:PREDICTED: uncharacterized protein LOC107800554 [Nicotiana tabacum]
MVYQIAAGINTFLDRASTACAFHRSRLVSGELELFSSMQVNHPNQGPVVLGQHAPEVTSFGVSNMEDIDQEMQLLDSIKLNSVEMPEAYHEGMNDVTEVSGHAEEKQPVYHRMKWTDDMVKLLITAVSYIGEDVLSNGVFIKKGKWRAISCVMAERGHHISPQQCEDKFNDMNKKFKRLNDILGRGTACHVMENPALLEMMDLSDNLKEEMKKLLGSKQLFYQEMCSYNNQNRLFLPHDQEVQQSVLLAVKGKDKCDTKNVLQDLPLKRKTSGEERVSKDKRVSMNNEEREIQDEHSLPRLRQLEEQKLQIQAQILELEKKRFKHMRFCSKEDKELQKMMLDNEVIKLENQRLVLELKLSGMRPFD